jgi:twinkle protein
MAETEWVSELLSRLRLFAQAHDIHIWFVAHPRKMQADANGDYPPPKGYDISGSAAWYAKADCGITVHRPDRIYGKTSEIHMWKCRHSWIGKEGVAELVFDRNTSQYLPRPIYTYAKEERLAPPKELDAPF